MAAVKKVNLTDQCFNESVFKKPPLPSRPSSGKFQIRGSGKIFRNTVQNDLHSQDSLELSNNDESIGNLTNNDALAVVLHKDAHKESDTPRNKTSKPEPRYRRQTKSAKARVNHNTKNGIKSDRQRPFSASGAISGRRLYKEYGLEEKVAVIDLADKVIPDLFEIEKEKLLALPEPKYDRGVFDDLPPMHFSKPLSEHFETSSGDKCFCKKSELSKKVTKGLKPSVYGLQHNRHVYGSAPDLTVINSELEKCPYKLSVPESESDKTLDSDKKSYPHTLEPLIPWLCHEVPEEVIGVDPSTCLVFLSETDWYELPEVPKPQDPEEDLQYIEDITTPRPWKPKKYHHPFFENKKLLVDDWVCNHRPSAPEPTDGEWHTIYRKTVKLPRMRTAEVIRKEIEELESLMKGVGTQDSGCGMVQYQSEITDFKDALQVTLNMIPERLKNPSTPIDTFGLKKVCTDHDILMEGIRQRVQLCREELADLEVEAGITTDRQYFRQRSNSIL